MDKKKDNDSSIDGDFLNSDGVAKYMHISRMSLYKIIKTDDTFPKGHSILSGKVRNIKLWKKQDIADWIISKTAIKSEH
tara:strand:- start:407 stop:643 length:237 start_codon:yes stop_codon:yes gene_type:complete